MWRYIYIFRQFSSWLQEDITYTTFFTIYLSHRFSIQKSVIRPKTTQQFLPCPFRQLHFQGPWNERQGESLFLPSAVTSSAKKLKCTLQHNILSIIITLTAYYKIGICTILKYMAFSIIGIDNCQLSSDRSPSMSQSAITAGKLGVKCACKMKLNHFKEGC